MNKRFKEFYSRKDLAALLGVKEKTIKNLVEKGAPKAVAFKGYSLVGFLEFIVNRPQKRYEKTKTREKAQKILEKVQKTAKKTKKKNKKEQGADPAPDKNKKQYRKGLKAALNRAREAEVNAYKKYQEELEKGTFKATLFNAWQSTLEVLRKMEKDCQSVLKEQGELVFIKDVDKWLTGQIETVKASLLNLPSKLAPNLENLPWQAIQTRLDQEIRDAIQKINTPQ